MQIRILAASMAISALGTLGFTRAVSPAVDSPLQKLRWMAGCLEMCAEGRCSGWREPPLHVVWVNTSLR
jgi:hypothetical protein